MRQPLIWVVASVILAISVAPTPSRAELQYGPWRNSGECRPASPPVGPGRGGVQMPRAPGGKGARECLWERQVLDCPKLRDVIRHPGKCTGKVRRQTKWSIHSPSD